MFLHKRQVLELERKYEHTHALLASHVKTIIERLSSIANRNILYGEIHEKYLKRYQKIKKEFEEPSTNAIESLKDIWSSNNNKAFKTVHGSYKALIFSFEKEVKNLIEELEQLMKQEEDIRALIYSKKEEVRQLKNKHREHQNELLLVDKAFQRLFANLDIRLKKLDEYVEIADYSEANNLINKIGIVVKQVLMIIEKLPALCVMIERVIPEKIELLREEIERLHKQKFPLHHLMINVTIEKINDELQQVVAKLCEFKIQGVEEQLQGYLDKIASYYDLFEIEKEAKTTFDRLYEETYANVNELERKFIKLNSSLPEIKKIYVIEDEQLQKIEIIRSLISNLNMNKRGLDTLVLSATRQPYSLQVNRIEQLREDGDKAISLMNEFQAYLSSLKTTSQQAFDFINDFFTQLKQLEHKIDELGVDQYTQTIEPKMGELHVSMIAIDNALKGLPIDMNVVSKHMHKLTEDGQALIDKINQDLNMAELAENAIVYANRDRHRLSDFNRLLTMSEKVFMDGQFQKTYNEVGNLLKKMQHHSLPINK
jgi:septation ring formation regulator EzrA